MPNNEIVIHIDKKIYKVEQATMTGAELRALPNPYITAEYQLTLQVPGGEDKPIADDEVIELKNGMHFFSVPKNLNAGRY